MNSRAHVPAQAVTSSRETLRGSTTLMNIDGQETRAGGSWCGVGTPVTQAADGTLGRRINTQAAQGHRCHLRRVLVTFHNIAVCEQLQLVNRGGGTGGSDGGVKGCLSPR